MSNSTGNSRKAENAYHSGAHGSFSKFLVEYELLAFFSFVCVCFCLVHALCYICLFSMSGHCPWVTFFLFPLESWF